MNLTPGLELVDQRDQLMASLLQCSSIMPGHCLDSLVCEYSRPATSYTDQERQAITMVLFHLLKSKHLQESIKSRIRIAAGLGRLDSCNFEC